ncbi:MAG: exonuclease subunit SbcD, partial [Spirochaetes bacterium]|nr:exonuclease subunit SbcD [Spirochaetota bacterium]
MLIFHLADLHLGKSLYERDLVEDQRHALAAVIAAVVAERPACVVVSGDVFDRAVPSADAVTLLGEFAAAIKAADAHTVIAMIPGNHDSAARLAFLAPVLASSGVYIASDPRACDVPVIVERGGEAARLWLLPFLTPGAFGVPEPTERPAPDATGPRAGRDRPAEVQADLFSEPSEPAEPVEPVEPSETAVPTLRSQADLFAEGVRRICAAMDRARASGAAPAADVLVCHAFAAGGAPSDSERVFLGAAELVDGSAFDSFDYVALGHLHRPQAVGAKGRYPGSILAYSFSEAGSERGYL